MDYDDVSHSDSMRNGAANAEPNDADTAIASIDLRLEFQTELARAMQIAAGHEQDRIAAAVRADAELQVDRTRTRAAVESAELRRLAEDDVERIRAWSDAEIERIQQESTRRIDERNVDLDRFLERHHAMVEGEVEAVAIAVHQYDTTLDQFFDDMTSSIDPAYIVRQADLIPNPPNLEIVRAAARADAVARCQEKDESNTDEVTGAAVDTVGVGVMDPAAISSTSTFAERAEAVDVGDPSEAHPNPAVRLWRSVAALTAPLPDGTTPRDR